MIIFKKLDKTDIVLARSLFVWFQEDDGDETIHVPTNEYIAGLLLKSDFHVIVALHEGRLVGGITAYELPMYKEQVNELFLYEIGVEEAYRQQNIATGLIDQLKKIAADRAIPEMYVGTAMDNLPAKKLYSKTGGHFEQIAWYIYKL